jgi:hypothetical protein
VPLESQITLTDELIDQIVYRLYGLTTGEIKIVEGSQMKVFVAGRKFRSCQRYDP